MDAIDASTGTRLKTIDVGAVSADMLSTDAAGTRLYVTDALNGSFVVDVASQTVTASNTTDPRLQSTLRSAMLDEYRNRLIVSIDPSLTGFGEFVGISAFSADSLQLLRKVRVPELPVPPPTRDRGGLLTQEIDFSGLSATLFVLQAVELRDSDTQFFDCLASQLIALDVDSGRVRRQVSTTDALEGLACRADLIRVTEPAPPVAGGASVASRQVTLTWQKSFGATSYEVEAGSAPGLNNLARFSTSEPRLVVDDVPAGVYYVRVRAINSIGASAASREIAVVVR